MSDAAFFTVDGDKSGVEYASLAIFRCVEHVPVIISKILKAIFGRFQRDRLHHGWVQIWDALKNVRIWIQTRTM
jgi:hypothetical protein